MTRKSIIPFGPQHPVLPEPIQLRLELEDETVVSARPVLGLSITAVGSSLRIRSAYKKRKN